MKIRIQKYLSAQGILSRRKAEEYIKKGWIKLNGEVVTEMGVRIDPECDKIELAEEVKEIQSKYIYLAYHKPKNILTNCASYGEKEIRDLLPAQYSHLNSIGRLDKDSEGLILLTDDGVFARSILDAKVPHEREYKVWTSTPLEEDKQERLEDGVYIQGAKTLPSEITMITPTHFTIILREGRNRQIRRMLWNVGCKVYRLKRVRFGSVTLGGLLKGEYRKLTSAEVNSFV